MKRKFIFLIVALVAVLSTASAWNKPVPVSQPLATDGTTVQYLYNPGAEGFLMGSNNYNTHASVLKTAGYKWRVEVVDETMPYYALVDSVEYDNDGKPCDWGWRRMFCNSAEDVYVDNNEGANNNTWQITPGNGNYFTISNSAFEGLLGVRPADAKDTRVYFASAYPEETFSTDWYAVSEAEYNNYWVAKAKYEAAMDLKAELDAAKAKYPSVDLSAQEAVFNNENSTIEEIKAATGNVQFTIRTAIGAGATWDSPVDFTEFIVDPSFETGDFGKWVAPISNDTGIKPNSNGTYHVDNCDGEYLFNTWGGNAALKIEQDLGKVPNGVYSLTALYASDANNVGLLFANTDTLSINSSSTGKTMFVEATAIVTVADNTINIGMTSSQWFKADHFRLQYHGNAPEAYKAFALASAPQFDPEDQITVSVLEEYNNTVESAVAGVTNREEAYSAIDVIKQAVPPVEENKVAWVEYLNKVKLGNETLQDEMIDQTHPDVLALGDYMMESEDIINNKELNTEELKAETAKLNDMIMKAMQCLKKGADFTKYLKNPEFDTKDYGWEGKPTYNEKCGEKYGVNGDFDVYQIIDADVPVGIYEISMQGFYREFRHDKPDMNSWYNVFEATEDAHTYKQGYPKPIAYVYMNSNKNPLNCVYDFTRDITHYPATETQPEEKYICDFYGENSNCSFDPYNKYAYPNTMANAAKAFAEGAYKVSAYGIVAKQGDKLRIGVKGHLGGNDWAIFDNFKLTFQAKDVTIINKLIPDAKTALDLTDKLVGKDVNENVATTLAQLESASTGDEKFDALAKAFELQATVETSVKNFEALYTAIGELESAITKASEIRVSEAVIKASAELQEEAYEGYLECKYTDAEAVEKLAEINAMIKKLQIPEFIGYDDNPVSFTGFIKNAECFGLSKSGDTKGTYGAWSFEKSSCQNGPQALGQSTSEFWNGDANTIQFHIYQTISGLPSGKYGLKVEANNSYNGQPSLGNSGHMYLYAQVEGKTTIPSVAIEATEKNADECDTYTVIFTLDKVQSRAGEEENVVTVGLKSAGKLDARWFGWRNFTLECYGTNSSKEDTPDAMTPAAAIEDVTSSDVATPVAVFNVSGTKIPAISKGLNIVRMSNGKVLKIMVK